MPDGTIYPNKPINMGGRKISGALTEDSDAGDVLATKSFADTKLNWRKEFVVASDPPYNVNDLVEFEGALYVCNTDSTVGSPTDYPLRWDTLPNGGSGGYLYTEVVGDGVESDFPINHGLGTSILAAPQGWEISTGIAVELKYQIVDDNTVNVSVSPGYEPDTDDLRIVINTHAGGTPIIVSNAPPPIWEAEFFEGNLRDFPEGDMEDGKLIKWLPSLAGGPSPPPVGFNIGATFYMRARSLGARKWLWACEGVAESAFSGDTWYSGDFEGLEYPNWEDDVVAQGGMAPILRAADWSTASGRFGFLPAITALYTSSNVGREFWRFNFGFTGRGSMRMQWNHLSLGIGEEPLGGSLFDGGSGDIYGPPFPYWSRPALSAAESNSVMQTTSFYHASAGSFAFKIDPTYYDKMSHFWVDALPERVIVDYTS